MKDIFCKTPTTSIIAVMITLLGFGGLAHIMLKHGDDATTRTQVVTGILGLLYIPAQYFFGSSKQKAVTQNADSISNSPAVGTEQNDGKE
jgi:hypothetical protein